MRAAAHLKEKRPSMPIIRITQTPGKTAEQKRELVREMTETFVRITGSKPESVWVTIEEVPVDSWAIAGVTLADRSAATKG
ncbi:4-oxalocrotonate tautomerase family protein [Streptomyces sp. NPDC056069]|uniref:tautomerase family protein n=1 Tax=Streptomyces sp. NPDC056069 TaxID=3345702 RepID=UPI0035E2D40A